MRSFYGPPIPPTKVRSSVQHLPFNPVIQIINSYQPAIQHPLTPNPPVRRQKGVHTRHRRNISDLQQQKSNSKSINNALRSLDFNQSLILEKSVEKEQKRDDLPILEGLLYYIKFVGRILKFLGSPTKVKLPQLQNSFSSYLHNELNKIASTPQNFHNHSISIPNLEKENIFQKKLQKCRQKYTMFYPAPSKKSPLSERLIKKGIRELISYLNENFDQKILICIDYLLTFLELYRMKVKYTNKQFVKRSNIEVIMEGNPYSVSREHVGQIRKKIQWMKI